MVGDICVAWDDYMDACWDLQKLSWMIVGVTGIEAREMYTPIAFCPFCGERLPLEDGVGQHTRKQT